MTLFPGTTLRMLLDCSKTTEANRKAFRQGPWVWSSLRVGLRYQSHDCNPSRCVYQARSRAGNDYLVRATSNLLRKSKDGQILERLTDLETLVSELLAFEAAEPRDTIYGVLALAKDTISTGQRQARKWKRAGCVVELPLSPAINGPGPGLDERLFKPRERLLVKGFMGQLKKRVDQNYDVNYGKALTSSVKIF